MNIGIPKESRPSEYRAGLSPAGVQMLTNRGHITYVEHDAGMSIGFTDQDYEKTGGKIVYSTHEAFGRADLVLKVARPVDEELEMMQDGAAVAGFLHLPSAAQSKIDHLLTHKISAIAYEQIQLSNGIRPVLRPLSQAGGKMAVQVAARLLQNNHGGKGILLGGMPGVPPAEVVIIGAGAAGSASARMALGMGAQVTVLDKEISALEAIHQTSPQIVTMLANSANIRKVASYADVIIAAAANPGMAAPTLITREVLKMMRPRSVIMDLAIDQGGSAETSRPTTHEKPTYTEEGIIHYCVPNISSLLARTASHVFFNAAIPYILELAEKGIKTATDENPALMQGLCTFDGKVINLSRLDINGGPK